MTDSPFKDVLDDFIRILISNLHFMTLVLFSDHKRFWLDDSFTRLIRTFILKVEIISHTCRFPYHFIRRRLCNVSLVVF